MIINHNLKDLQKELKNLSTFDRIIFLEKLKHKEVETEQMERRLEYSNNERLKNAKPKKFSNMNNEVLG